MTEEERSDLRRAFDEYASGLNRYIILQGMEAVSFRTVEVTPSESWQVPPIIHEEKPETWRDRPPLL